MCMFYFHIFYCFTPLLDSKSYQIKDYVLYVMFTALCTFSVLTRRSVVIFIYVCVCVCVCMFLFFFCGKIYINILFKYNVNL